MVEYRQMGIILRRPRILVQMSPLLHPDTTPGLGHHLPPHPERNRSGPRHPLHRGEFPLTLTRCGLLCLPPSYSQPLCRMSAPLLHPRSSNLRRMFLWSSRLTSGGSKEYPVPQEKRTAPPSTVDQVMVRSAFNQMETITTPLCLRILTWDFETQTQRQMGLTTKRTTDDNNNNNNNSEDNNHRTRETSPPQVIASVSPPLGLRCRLNLLLVFRW